MKYGQLNMEQVEAIINKLGGMEGAERFLRGELEVKVAECFFPVWKRVTLGTGLKTADDFRHALKKSDCYIGYLAYDMLGQHGFKASKTAVEAELVSVSVSELGFKDGATRRDIYARAKELGLELCPAEAGPQLRLQYNDQPLGEWRVIAMDPIVSSYGNLSVFSVERVGDSLWLNSGYGNPESFWDGDDQWVFLRRE